MAEEFYIEVDICARPSHNPPTNSGILPKARKPKAICFHHTKHHFSKVRKSFLNANPLICSLTSALGRLLASICVLAVYIEAPWEIIGISHCSLRF